MLAGPWQTSLSHPQRLASLTAQAPAQCTRRGKLFAKSRLYEIRTFELRWADDARRGTSRVLSCMPSVCRRLRPMVCVCKGAWVTAITLFPILQTKGGDKVS